MDWYRFLVTVGITLGIAYVALSVWVMFAILDLVSEAKAYYQRENKDAWRASLERNKIPR